MKATRTERDSMGELDVPKDALYGAQTQRAIQNFPISGQRMPLAFLQALILQKKAAAQANLNLATLDESKATAIIKACDTLLADDILKHFPVDVFQTGSGTSTNMNANEVIAHIARRDSQQDIHPNDHVNCGQSSNDVIPTTIHISAALEVSQRLLPALKALVSIIEEKADEVACFCKTGRTHLMDAMPVRMDQSLRAWSSQISQQIQTLNAVLPSIQQLAQGGTAVGTGVNAHPDFGQEVARELSDMTGIAFKQAENVFSLISAQDNAVTLSGCVKSTAVSLMKIANDLRWMNSGPLAGLGEIALPALQPGSSIMPGKINPVIPEAVAMASAQVMGNDSAISVGGQSGNFELNVMLPMIASNLLSSIHLMTTSATQLGEKAIKGFSVNQENLDQALEKNPILVTALNPIIGYSKAAEIAKAAYKQKRPVLDVALEMTDIPKEELITLLDPVKLTDNSE
ncbi:aspartate ammonia-lyase [Alteromonas australica]|jgi:fumarate hydratase, class II|uniref:Fumarate hydratase class II n=2 Tax=Alteromonas australica TaxID=589873 RepID=A0A358DU48_9ALTE|nr:MULTISPECIES: class II fumarate hydratase [Alteromonas]MAB92649.1 class II fumarate hydratase [Alteromonas sp.]AJP44888.1 aspartate ammonia-lyase [Alteromonas australica]MAF69433.1 class II fumarate hydratase [Alteromonas sp.]MAF71734.1 class II fumarate hydratase [Alteromonas sp.]MBU34393.1 class II fumarate hydratase [Alteromonas sp.]|tara:strand:- start:3473 stop:4849 length:1377 start_codon:yes stop_codon:yes gene_type:complete